MITEREMERKCDNRERCRESVITEREMQRTCDNREGDAEKV